MDRRGRTDYYCLTISTVAINFTVTRFVSGAACSLLIEFSCQYISDAWSPIKVTGAAPPTLYTFGARSRPSWRSME